MHALAILISLKIQSLFLRIILIFLQDNLSGLGDDELLHFLITCKSSFLEKGAHVKASLEGISSNKLISTWWLCAELKDLYRAFHRSDILIHGWLLKWITSIASNFLFFTQFISFQSSHFLLMISLILLSKNLYLVLLTVSLNFFQSLSCLVCLYVSRS